MQYFNSDYMEGAHPKILQRLMQTNMEKTTGYGLDEYCESAKDKIRKACNYLDAEVHFFVGGTQTNATVIDALLASYQGVIAADSGHISTHEAGAIELNGHKVLTLPNDFGKLSVQTIRKCLKNYHEDGNKDHVVMPGMVYISHPTEYGTLYTKAELEEIHAICKDNNIPLYIDGARLGYALASDDTDVTLEVLAQNCDVFYIGGTKVGALFGEALVVTKKDLLPRFFTVMKQHGALLAKGRLLGLQFDTLFTDELYTKIARNAIERANEIKTGLLEKGYKFYFQSPTNQQFIILSNDKMQELSKKIGFSFWEVYDDEHTVIRFATSWATTKEDVQQLMDLL